MATWNKPACGNLCVLYLCLSLLVTVCVQGVPAGRGRSNPKSGTKLAGEHTNRLRKVTGGAAVPLLPPGDELGLAELNQERSWKLQQTESEEDGVSGNGATGGEGISGDDEIPPNTRIPFRKPQLPKGKAE